MSSLRPLLPSLGAWWRGLPQAEHWFLIGMIALTIFGAWMARPQK